jgi:serine/threonine-protein kinase RsbW
VLLPASGRGQLVWGGRSTPLGTYGQSERDEAELRLGGGDRLLLYTDGLVERRDRALDDGLAALALAVAAARAEPLTVAVRGIADTMLHDEQGRDDVCMLLLEWAGGRTRFVPGS